MTAPTDSNPPTTLATPTGSAAAPGTDGAARAWVRSRVGALVTIGAALAVFLLGAAAGMLIGLPGGGTATPDVDSVDVGFSQDMTVHHEQGVEMASFARDHSTDPVIRSLAYDIESTQTAEIGRMQGWLTLWEAPQLPAGLHMAWMAGFTGGHNHGGGGAPGGVAPGGVQTMPGMASTADLTALRAASGKALDVLFLQLMLRHHEGGAGMLDYGAQYASVPAVRSLAGQMAAAQSVESDHIRSLLAERGAAPLPF